MHWLVWWLSLAFTCAFRGRGGLRHRGRTEPAKNIFNETLPSGDIEFDDDATLALPKQPLPAAKGKATAADPQPLYNDPLDYYWTNQQKLDFLTKTFGYQEAEVITALRINNTLSAAIDRLSAAHNVRGEKRACLNKQTCFRGCDEKTCWKILDADRCISSQCWSCVAMSVTLPSVVTIQQVKDVLAIREIPASERSESQNRVFNDLQSAMASLDTGKCSECKECTDCSDCLVDKTIPASSPRLRKLAQEHYLFVSAYEEGGNELWDRVRADSVSRTLIVWKKPLPVPLWGKNRLRFQGGVESLPALWQKLSAQRPPALTKPPPPDQSTVVPSSDSPFPLLSRPASLSQSSMGEKGSEADIISSAGASVLSPSATSTHSNLSPSASSSSIAPTSAASASRLIPPPVSSSSPTRRPQPLFSFDESSVPNVLPQNQSEPPVWGLNEMVGPPTPKPFGKSKPKPDFFLPNTGELSIPWEVKYWPGVQYSEG